MKSETTYDVALSFAGENRTFVESVARILQAKDVRVFYDEDARVELWGKNLPDRLDEIYRKQSEYVVIFISKHYASKTWPNHERKSALARAIEERREYILPARFDDTELPGLQPTIAYIDLTDETPESFAELVLHKLSGANRHTSQRKLGSKDSPPLATAEDKQRYEDEISRLYQTKFITDKIIVAPHWRIFIRPTAFAPDRIESLSDCEKLVKSCAVTKNNWQFPFLKGYKRSFGNDWIDGTTNFRRSVEHWRIYQSGLFFFHTLSIEEFSKEDVVKKVKWDVPIPHGVNPPGYRDIVTILRTVTEAFEFASNYAEYPFCAGGITVGISLHNVKNHILFVWDHQQHLRGFFQTSDAVLGKHWEYTPSVLRNEVHPLALKAACYFYERFGWFDPPMDDLRQIQTSG